MALEKTSEAAGKKDLKVMVVGDGEDAVSQLSSLLQDQGMETTTVRRQEWCSGSLSRNSPSVVIIAAQAGSDGWEISSRIRRESDVPIIVAGAAKDQGAWVKAAEYGVDYYLPQPVSPRELVARIRALVRRCRPWSAEIGDIKITKVQDTITKQ